MVLVLIVLIVLRVFGIKKVGIYRYISLIQGALKTVNFLTFEFDISKTINMCH